MTKYGLRYIKNVRSCCIRAFLMNILIWQTMTIKNWQQFCQFPELNMQLIQAMPLSKNQVCIRSMNSKVLL